jgi:hypothetical protein
MLRPHQLALRQNVPLHRTQQILPGHSRLQFKKGVERVNPEVVAMRFARRRTRPAVPQPVEIVQALFGSARQILRPGRVLRQFGRGGRQVEEDPMKPSASGRVGVVSDERKTFWRWPVRRSI